MKPVVRVNRKAAERVAAGHPWIFSSDVTSRGNAEPGDVVAVLGPRDRMLGVAHFSSSSQICLRMLAEEECEIGREFWLSRLRAALALRNRLISGTDAYRLVHGEADLLPALVVDRYGGYLSIQTLSQGMEKVKGEIVASLEELLSPMGIVERNDSPVRKHEELAVTAGVLRGEIPERVRVTMNGLQFGVDLLHGQKTGLFLDQRENYAAAARYAKGQALDLFCSSTAGFALHMARRCEAVEAVDSSGTALRQAVENRDANGIGNVIFREANVFDLLNGYRIARRRYDMIVLDPPAFAKSRGQVEGALRGYKQINLRALELLGPGGVLVTCSCSQHIAEGAFLEMVAGAALDARRMVRVLERRTQSQDHPILLTAPETHYLKCLILDVL
jgi:23S rRNA (cytosine1962-C5)-methyltransferase